MDTWHIPLRSFDDALEGLFDFTFPPRRYLSSIDSWPISSRGFPFDDSFIRPLIWPYPLERMERSKSSEKKEGGFKVDINVNHYKPDEISMKVEGQTLTVQGKHEHESENGFERSEFRRQYTLPQDVDTGTVTSKITKDGILRIEAANLPKALKAADSALTASDDKLAFTVDVCGYKPEEISGKVVGRNLIIHGEARMEEGDNDNQLVHHKQFRRQLAIPEDVDMSALSTRYSKEGKVIVEAPRIKAPIVAERKLELKLADDAKDEKEKET